MSNDLRGISVKILGKDYQVTCPEGKEAPLMDAAHFLDRKMTEIRHGSKIFGLERIAVMAALNLAHELLLHRNNTTEYAEIITTQLQNLHDKLDGALNSDQLDGHVIEAEADVAAVTVADTKAIAS